MQPASPDRSPAAQTGESHRSPKHSPREKRGTPKTTDPTDLEPATNTNSCRSEAETPRIARLTDRIARGPRLDDRPETGKRQSRRRQLFPPGESMLQPGQCPPGQGIRPSRPGWVVGWWTGDTVLSPPTDFFRQGLPRAAFNEAPMIEHTEPSVLPSATDHGASGAQVRQSANKALPRSDDGDQAQPHVPHACARKPAKQPPPQVEVLAIEAEVARGLARLTALSSMAEPQRRQLSCAYCWWDRRPRHMIECCLHKPGCCVCGQTHKGHDWDRLTTVTGMKAAQQALKCACAGPRRIRRCTLRWRCGGSRSMPRHGGRRAQPCTRPSLCGARLRGLRQ